MAGLEGEFMRSTCCNVLNKLLSEWMCKLQSWLGLVTPTNTLHCSPVLSTFALVAPNDLWASMTMLSTVSI